MKITQRLKSSNKFNPLIMLFYGLIVGTVGYIIISSRAAPPPPTVYLTPASQTFAINTTFTVDIRENSGTTPVNTVQAKLSYPANLVDYVSMDTSSSAFKTVVQTTGGTGQVTFIGGTPTAGTPPVGTSVTGDQMVARITFKSKTTGGAAAMAFTSGTYLISTAGNVDILGSLAATGGGTYTIDATAPSVSMTSPAVSAVLAGGSTNTIAVTATDNSSVAKVEILVDNIIKATVTAPPYNYSWNTTGLALGSHALQAKAYDPYGNVASTAVNNVTLTDQTAPTISITSPPAGQVSGTVNFTATASDNSGGSGLAKVDFYVDGAPVATDTTSPYTFSWNSKTVQDGARSLTAKATDNASPANTKVSTPISVTVDNADHIAPTTPGSFRSTAKTQTSISLAWNASTDNVGVTGYKLQRNGATLTTTTSLTYTDSNLTPGTSYTYSLVAIDGASNNSAPATLTLATIALKTGDINNDGGVDSFDLSLLLSNFGSTTNAAADLNNNGSVDVFDLSIILSNFGT